MNYPEQLLKEHSRANADLVLNHVLGNNKRVAALMDAFLEGEYRVVQRSAMVVGDLGREQPDWLKPWHSRMIAAADPAPHPSVSRNVMRYFSELSLSAIKEEDQGPLLDLAFRLAEDQVEAVAIRIYSISMVFNFCALYPELKDELRGIIELTIAEGTTPGFRSRGKKILAALNR